MAERKPTYEELATLVEQQAKEIARLKQRIAELEEQLQAAHRQAAPFRRREAKKKPPEQQKKPGRAKGHEGHYREPPEQVDCELSVPLEGCPLCGGEVFGVTRCE